MEKKLEIKNLRIAFRTNNGTVKAVRDISLDLNKGETLAIVGESGSGKSVMVRAIMGILAPNAIIDGGEIIYDGKDLLKISEDEFHTLRGNRLAMIFQDPLSSLNPIMRIGVQLTEAMRLNNKERRRDAKRRYAALLGLLEEAMNSARQASQKDASQGEIHKHMDTFKRFTRIGVGLEAKYTLAREALMEAQGELEDLLLEATKGLPKSIQKQVKALLVLAQKALNPYLISGPRKVQYQTIISGLKTFEANYTVTDAQALIKQLELLKAQMADICQAEQPNFFRIGYTYLTQQQKDPDQHSTSDINVDARKKLDQGFMMGFLREVEGALAYSHQRALAAQSAVLPKLQAALPVFQRETLDKKECLRTARHLSEGVKKAIDPLAIQKENLSYVFSTSLEAAINRYFEGISANPGELKRVERDEKDYRQKVEKGKFAPSVIPPSLVDTHMARANMVKTLTDLIAGYEQRLADQHSVSTQEWAVGLVDTLKSLTSAYAYRLTKGMAKQRALGLMNEVGIPEPRKRYRQYPFQMSGGQRQRIVIAIALAADPDILICDEPTTALDVTIQAQILELINRLKQDRKLAIVFITHDLGVVANMADRIAVMYAGKVVEYGNADDVFYDPRHPYTWALLSSMPDLETKEKLEAIPGTPPNMIIPPVGDAFAARNQYAMKIDFEQQPPFFKISDTHYAATWLLHPQAPTVVPPAIVTERIARMKQQEAQSRG